MKRNLLYILIFSTFCNIFFIKKVDSNIGASNDLSYLEKRLVKDFLSDKKPRLNIDNSNINKIIQTLKRFDKKNSPQKVVVDGKIKYRYRKLPNEPLKTIEELERLIKNPQQTRKYEVFIKKSLLFLLSNEIKISLKDLEEREPSGQWIHKDKTVIINKNILKEGTINFAHLLSHEIIHIAQSCKGGGFDSYPVLLGLELDKPKSYYYKFLENDIYRDLKEKDIMLEVEAYANQKKISQTINAFKYYCLQDK